jgi:isocitrate lyase
VPHTASASLAQGQSVCLVNRRSLVRFQHEAVLFAPSTSAIFQIIEAAPKGRYKGIKRNYEVEDVLKLRGSIDIEYTLATRGANKLWQLLHTEPFVAALGAQTGNQAVQMIRAGLKAIYLSGEC